MNLVGLTQLVVERALQLGFEQVGVIPAQQPPHFEQFQSWLDKGFHGEMGYLWRNQKLRRQPRSLHQGTQSIIAVAMSYRPSGGVEPILNVARYAWGNDYHQLMRKRLAQLGRFIDSELNNEEPTSRAFVDSAPILERGFAHLAGLGWVGKNTNLINQTLGSTFFLGELFVEAELDAVGHPVPDRCGTCSACVEGCPTGAIVAPHCVDARRCISYLTIELKGSVDPSLREMMGENLFGCDICQTVCPWNRKAQSAKEPAFQLRAEWSQLTEIDLLQLSQPTFDRLFKSSPLRRAKREGLARNAAIVLGNRCDPDSIPGLVGALKSHTSPLVRGHVAWALGRFRDVSAGSELEVARNDEQHPYVLDEIGKSLKNHK